MSGRLSVILPAGSAVLFALLACAPPPPPEPPCTPVETTAQDPQSGACLVFSSNCTPQGWARGCVVEVPKEPQTPLDKSSCSRDEDCVCGGIDELTNECYLGNRDYYREHVDKSQACPDFCGGIAGNLAVVCRDGRCAQEAKQLDAFEPNASAAECVRDADCDRAGCSKQLCVPAEEAPGVITTCEWRPEYAHIDERCGCADGTCTWIPESDTSRNTS